MRIGGIIQIHKAIFSAILGILISIIIIISKAYTVL